MTAAETIITGEVNEAGESALIEWLRGRLREPFHAEAFVEKLLGQLDGSFAEARGLSVELGSRYTASGNPEIYSFADDEYDLVTYDDLGNVLARNGVESAA